MRISWKPASPAWFRQSRIVGLQRQAAPGSGPGEYVPHFPDADRELFDQKLEDPSIADESVLRRTIDFASAHPSFVGPVEFDRLLSSRCWELLPVPFVNCLRKIAVHDAACEVLFQRGFVAEILSHCSLSSSPDLVCSILKLFGSMAKRSERSATLLVAGGIFNSFSPLIERLISAPIDSPAAAYDHSMLFDALLRSVASFVRLADEFSLASFVRICQEFPRLVENLGENSYRHLYVRRLLRFAIALFVNGEDAILRRCEDIVPFALGHLEADDSSIRELSLLAAVAVSGQADDHYLDLVSSVLGVIPGVTEPGCRKVACLVLRNFAAAMDLSYVRKLMDPGILAMIGSAMEDDPFIVKQSAYLAACYLMAAMPDEFEPFLIETPARVGGLVGVLTECSDPAFQRAVVTCMLALFRREEARCQRQLGRNRIAQLLWEADVREALESIDTEDAAFAELIGLLKVEIEGAVILDRIA